jgi:ferredoxin
MLHIEVDSNVCQGHGRCYDLAPDLFVADELGYSSVRSAEAADDMADKAHRAEGSCPERAITVSRA